MPLQNNRIPLLAANWKMHKTFHEAKIFFEDFAKLLPEKPNREVLICPPFTLLHLAVSFAGSKYEVGGQDLFWETEGAYTGEISPLMLKDAGCRYVLVAHSERRRYFGETDFTANKKIHSAFEQGLKPIFCVGETLDEMEGGKTREVLDRQVRGGLAGVQRKDFERLALAYEPVWAIGTGKADTPGQSNKTIGFIRELLSEMAGHHEGQRVRILYGGSVNPNNIDSFMEQTEIDGALVGGASLNPESFCRIVRYHAALKS